MYFHFKLFQNYIHTVGTYNRIKTLDSRSKEVNNVQYKKVKSPIRQDAEWSRAESENNPQAQDPSPIYYKRPAGMQLSRASGSNLLHMFHPKITDQLINS